MSYALGTLGCALVAAGRYSEAIRPLERALAFPSTDAWARAARLFFLGEAYLGTGRIEEAQEPGSQPKRLIPRACLQ